MIAFEDVREAVEVLAIKWPDMEPDGGTALAAVVLDQLPGATMAEFEAYCEAVSNWWDVAKDGASPDGYLEDWERQVLRRDEWRDLAIQRCEEQQRDALDVLLSRHPRLLAVAS